MSPDFPLIYCNGDSYSNPLFHPALDKKTFAEYVGNALNGFVLNQSINGSCNRRIVRTSLYDMIEQRRVNPNQKIILLLNLTFEIRSDLWVDDIKVEREQESHFVGHQFAKIDTWKEKLLKGKPIYGIATGAKRESDMLSSRFLPKLNHGKAFFYSPYAERINLYADLIMFTAFCDQHNINYLIFQSPRAEKLQEEHLLDTFKSKVNNNAKVFDLENFGFLDWAYNQKYKPLDKLDLPQIGHYNKDAHKAFAEQVLIPKLEETKQI